VLAAGLIGTLATVSVITLVRRKRGLVRQRDEMRARIARDLHNDLGSRLGGMRLIGESLLVHPELPSTIRSANVQNRRLAPCRSQPAGLAWTTH
jgi:signal transduction histidine kinase